MRKKVIFMIINMNVGGTERALLNMIEEMPEDKYDITILMLEKYGGFLEYIPKRVQQKFLTKYCDMKPILNKSPKEVVTKYFKKGLIIKGIILTLIFSISKLTKSRGVLFKYLLKDVPDLKIEYDTAIAYAGPMDFISYFVIHKIKAKKKIQWVHFDVSKIGFNEVFSRKIYQQFNQIYVVSEEGRDKLIKKVSDMCNKIKVFHNIVSPTKIFYQSENGNSFNDEFNGFRILTVGRLSEEKGQDLAIEATKKLIDDGYNIKWYCIGEGHARQKYEKRLMKYKLENSFIMLGEKINPYAYINECDIYVQPSRYEGYCISVIEAKYLNKPIIATNVNGVKEQIVNDETGIIIKSNVEELTSSIKRLINDKHIGENIVINLKNEMKNKNNFKNNIESLFI